MEKIKIKIGTIDAKPEEKPERSACDSTGRGRRRHSVVGAPLINNMDP